MSEILNYDSRIDTYQHKANVATFIHEYIKNILKRQYIKRENKIIIDLLDRALNHDNSKLQEPELKYFNMYTPKLKTSTYGSKEYKENLEGLSEGLQHHYENNTHHPEHWMNGINDMTLVDLIEMISDWKSAVMRHEDGDIYKSLEINQKRFNYDDELKDIFINTIFNMVGKRTLIDLLEEVCKDSQIELELRHDHYERHIEKHSTYSTQVNKILINTKKKYF